MLWWYKGSTRGKIKCCDMGVMMCCVGGVHAVSEGSVRRDWLLCVGGSDVPYCAEAVLRVTCFVEAVLGAMLCWVRGQSYSDDVFSVKRVVMGCMGGGEAVPGGTVWSCVGEGAAAMGPKEGRSM